MITVVILILLYRLGMINGLGTKQGEVHRRLVITSKVLWFTFRPTFAMPHLELESKLHLLVSSITIIRPF